MTFYVQEDNPEVREYADAVALAFFAKIESHPDLLRCATTYWSTGPYGYCQTRGVLDAIDRRDDSPLGAEQKRDLLQMLLDSALEARQATLCFHEQGETGVTYSYRDESDTLHLRGDLGAVTHSLLSFVAAEAIGAEYSRISDEETFETGVFTRPEGIDLSFLSGTTQPNLFRTAAIDAYRYVQDKSYFSPTITQENVTAERAKKFAYAIGSVVTR